MFKKLGSKLKEQKGFTLIELLAVIVILGIIAAIAIPAIGNVINKSEVKAQAQEGVQIINAAKMYVANETVNVVATTPTVGGTVTGTPTKLTKDLLSAYLDRYDAKTDFYVNVVKVGTSGKFSYSLVNHPSAGAEDKADSASTASKNEQELINLAK
jgi:type IV pilus assembly protein PilA